MISTSIKTELYRAMVRIRCCEEALVEPILNGEIRCPVHLYSGEEAIAAGVCLALRRTDCVFGNHRSHGHFLAKGGSMKELVAEVFCRETGCSKGRGGSMHLCSPENGMLGSAPIVAGTVSLALGAALASSIRKRNAVTVSFFGDGAVGEGVLYESINFAALRKLPIIFVCENNFYSTHLSIRECRPAGNISRIGKAFSIDCHTGNGNDALAVYRLASQAVRRCRDGQGPVFLEFKTYRLRGHVGPDDNVQGMHTDIRPAEEISRWRRKDPIAALKKRLRAEIPSNKLEKIERAAAAEVAAALEFARTSPRPDGNETRDYIYAHAHS